jgi:hypothetical protein
MTSTAFDRQKMKFMYTSYSSFRGADCDTDHYLVFAEYRERL